MKTKKKQKNFVQKIALARIMRLFELAEKEFKKNPARSNAWVQLALHIGTRNRVRTPIQLKQLYCKHCHAFLVEGKNKKTTIKNGFVEILCGECHQQFKRQTNENGMKNHG